MSTEPEEQTSQPAQPNSSPESLSAPQPPDPRYPPLPPYAPYPPYPYPAYPPQAAYPPNPGIYGAGPGAPWPQPGAYPPPPDYYGPPGQGQPGGWGPPGPQSSPWGQPPQPYPGQPVPGQPVPGEQMAWPQPQVARRPSVFTLYLLPILSAIVSMGAYGALFGWQFGIGILLSLLVHEMGHYIVIRAKGLPARLPIFIPLVGAFVTMPRMPSRVRDEAEIGIAGPVAGALAGFACLVAYRFTGAPVLISLAYFGFLINLLNLIPVSPLDGARVTSAISKWIWLLGLVGVAAGAYYTHNILLVLLGVFGLFQTIQRFGQAGKSAYYHISLAARTYITILYFGLAATLAWGVYALHPLAILARMYF